jgi:hypothetical protein
VRFDRDLRAGSVFAVRYDLWIALAHIEVIDWRKGDVNPAGAYAIVVAHAPTREALEPTIRSAFVEVVDDISKEAFGGNACRLVTVDEVELFDARARRGAPDEEVIELAEAAHANKTVEWDTLHIYAEPGGEDDEHPMSQDRQEVLERIQAAVASWLDEAYEQSDEFEIGTIAVVFEMLYPDNATNIGWTCSDPRNWVQAGLFRRAHMLAEEDAAITTDDE